MTTDASVPNAASRSRSSPTPRRGRASSPTPARAPAGTTTSPRPSASRPTTRTSPSTSSPTRGTTSPRAGSTASPTARPATRCTGRSSRPGASTSPSRQRGIGSGGMQVQNWPAHGWHEFRDPNEEWEQTLYRYNANVVRQLNQNVENARNSKAFDFWATELGALRRAARRRVDAHRAHPRALRVRLQRALLSDEHAQHRAGRQQRAQDPLRAGPGAVQPHPERGDRGLRRRARTSRRGTPTPSGRAPAS